MHSKHAIVHLNSIHTALMMTFNVIGKYLMNLKTCLPSSSEILITALLLGLRCHCKGRNGI